MDLKATIRNFNTHQTANGGLFVAVPAAVTLIFGGVAKVYCRARFPAEADGIDQVLDSMTTAAKAVIGPAILMCYAGMPHGVGDPGAK